MFTRAMWRRTRTCGSRAGGDGALVFPESLTGESGGPAAYPSLGGKQGGHGCPEAPRGVARSRSKNRAGSRARPKALSPRPPAADREAKEGRCSSKPSPHPPAEPRPVCARPCPHSASQRASGPDPRPAPSPAPVDGRPHHLPGATRSGDAIYHCKGVLTFRSSGL